MDGKIHQAGVCRCTLKSDPFLPIRTFADDVTLLALFPTFLKVFMNICHQYSVTWRYEFNHLKSGVAAFGEAKSVHSRLLTEREWLLCETTVNELCEYKNLGVIKNCIGSFSSDVEDNIKKARKKAGMIFSSDFDRRKTNPLVQILEASVFALSIIWNRTFFFKCEPTW